jgi:hypothetical protein
MSGVSAAITSFCRVARSVSAKRLISMIPPAVAKDLVGTRATAHGMFAKCRFQTSAKVGEVVDPGEIDLRLQRARQRRAGRRQRRLQFLRDQKFGLLADLGSGPGRMLRDMRPRIDALSGIVRHLPGDEDEIVADDDRHEARARGGVDARRMDLADYPPRQRRDQRGRDVVVGGEAAFHDHRGAGRDVVTEFGVAGEMVGVDRGGFRIVLIEADGVAEIGAELAQNMPHPAQDEIALAAGARSPKSGKPGAPATSPGMPRSKSNASFPFKNIHGPDLTA